MENPTSFDLKANINKWRGSLETPGTLRADDLNELEHHLRESMERLRAKELSEDEAFFVATKRLGKTEQLACEFDKAHPTRVWQGRLVWMVAGVVLFNLLVQLPGLAFLITGWAAQLPINGNWLGLLLVILDWSLLIVPTALVMWLCITNRELCRRSAALALSHPVMTAFCLVAFSTMLLLLIALPFPIGAHPMIATREASVRFGTASVWQTYGFHFPKFALLPIALVYLAHRQWKYKAN